MTIRNDRGASQMAVFLWLFLLFATIHVGFKWLSVHFDAWRLEDEITSKASMAQVLKDDEIIYGLEKKAKELDLPLRAENFKVQRNEERKIMTISTAWEVEVRYFWGLCGEYCVYTYLFQPSAEGPMASSGK